MLSYVISLSVLIGIILILRAAFRRSVSPRIMYAVWMIVLIRMLVPFSLFTVRIELPEPVSAVLTPGTVDPEVNGTTPDGPGTVNIEEPGSISPVTPGTESESQTAPGEPSVRPVLLTVWASGSVAVALFFIISGIRFRLRLKRGRRPTDDFRGVPVYISGCVSVPSVVGVFRPAIFIPAEVEDEMARELILTHEYMHIRHGDQIWSLMRILAVVFYWWNPLVWIAAIMSKRDSELACDESVASRLSRENRYYYARLLLESIPMRQPFALGFGSAPMKERISMLTDNIKNTSRAIIATVLLISFAFCAFGCSFASAAADGSGKVSDSDSVSEDEQSSDEESDDTTNIPAEVEQYDPFEHEITLTDDPESKRLYVFNESMKLSQTIGNDYPPNYAGQVYGDDGYLHICVTSLDNTKLYTDIIDGSIIQFDLVEFSLNYLESVKAKVIPLLGSEYGIYSVGIQQKINKVSISTSNRDHIDDIAAVLSEFDKNSYEIVAPSDSRPAEPPAEETTRTTPNLDPDTVTEPIVTEPMKKVNKSYGDLITALSNLPSYDEKPENYAGCYTDFEDKDNPRLHILVTALDDLGFYKEHVDESVTSFHVVDFSWWYLLEFQDYVSNEIRPRLQLSGLNFHGAKVNVEKNKLTIITYDDPECDELIAELINEASFDENSYEFERYVPSSYPISLEMGP